MVLMMSWMYFGEVEECAPNSDFDIVTYMYYSIKKIIQVSLVKDLQLCHLEMRAMI
jgi:hypothetical protein